MIVFLFGFILGASLVIAIVFLYLYDPWAPVSPPPPFIDQFRPIQIPEELKQFLKTGEDGQGISKWESCHSLSLFFHMFFQEHKDTRQLRRWIHKRLQMELNDIATRSAAGRLLQEIRIRDLSVGTKFPCLNAMRVESAEMSPDKTIFEKIVFLLDIDYNGGFETSIDVTTMFGKKVNLAVKITKLAGVVRFILSRKPFSHWAMSFVSAPEFETDISSQIQGHQLKRLIPLIKESFRRALQRKHVWPNYKIRYRPVFPNPLLQPSPPLSAFSHVKLKGGLEVTVLQCSRLKTDLVSKDGNWEIYCTLSLDQRPFLQDNSQNVAHSLSVLLVFSRYDLNDPIGICFEKVMSSTSVGPRPVRVASVDPGSLAEKAAFKPGDIFVAINNVPIRSERQVVRFLQQTLGDLMVLVDRKLDDISEGELHETELILGDTTDDPDDAFVALGCMKPSSSVSATARVKSLSDADFGSTLPTSSPINIGSDDARRHSFSVEPSSITSVNGSHTTGSINSSLQSIDTSVVGSLPSHAVNFASVSVQRTESARVPHVLVSQPSTDLRRTRSESQIDKVLETCACEDENAKSSEVEEPLEKLLVGSLNRERVNSERNMLYSDYEERDSTLKAGSSLKQEMAREGSSASLLSSTSVRTDVTEDTDDTECKLNRDRSGSTRRQRLQATFLAGKKRVMEFIPQKKRSLCETVPLNGNESIEVGADATDVTFTDTDPQNLSPAHVPSNGRKSPLELTVIDKEKRDKKKKKKGGSRVSSRNDTNTGDSPTSSLGSIKSRNTRAAPFRENVLWGQSLHFDLEPSTSLTNKPLTKYLNITIHVRQTGSSSSTPDGTPQKAPVEPKRPITLGYVSLYIPQIIDDCNLTLSNCHREVFPLKPPAGIESSVNLSSCSEYARHAGFDPRLCYGDVTLGFRYFHDGLPQDAGLNAGEDLLQADISGEDETRSSSPMPSTSSTHYWQPWTSKAAGSTICAMCRGKIWLKSGSCCQRCLVVCHVKCTAKANYGIVCSPHSSSETDAQFEEIDAAELFSVHAESTNHSEPQLSATRTPPNSPPTHELHVSESRRTRLRNKVTEKLSLWRRKPKKEESESSEQGMTDNETTLTNDSTISSNSQQTSLSPMASIEECLSDILIQLDGSPFINNLFYQRGNAYNEHTISNARELGKNIFSNLPGPERKAKINEQIDIIQAAIRETKDGRLAAMKDQTNPATFEGLDERLQALAVLMLHYCAALQDCVQQDRSSPSIIFNSDEKNSSSDRMSSIANHIENGLVDEPSTSLKRQSSSYSDLISLSDGSATQSQSDTTIVADQ